MSVAAGSGRSNYYRQALTPVGVARVAAWPALIVAWTFEIGDRATSGQRHRALVQVVDVVDSRIVMIFCTDHPVGVVRLLHPDLRLLGVHVHRSGEHLRGGQRTDVEGVATATETLAIGIVLIVHQLVGGRQEHLQVGIGDHHTVRGQIETVGNREGVGGHVYLSLDLRQRKMTEKPSAKRSFQNYCAEVKGVVRSKR